MTGATVHSITDVSEVVFDDSARPLYLVVLAVPEVEARAMSVVRACCPLPHRATLFALANLAEADAVLFWWTPEAPRALHEAWTHVRSARCPLIAFGASPEEQRAALLALTTLPTWAQGVGLPDVPELTVMPFGGYNFDIVMGGNADAAIQLDFNLVATFGTDASALRPYAGAGLGVVASSGDLGNNEDGEDFQGDSGFNVIGGVIFNDIIVISRPFVQARFSTIGPAGDDSFTVQGGLVFCS